MLFSSPSTSGANSSVEVMSRVLSVSVPDTQVTNLRDPVTMSFGIPPSKSNYDNATCVYWDFTLQNGIGDWSSDGCVINSMTDDVIICDCNHLTHFAVLIEFRKKDAPIEVLFALTVISRVGCLVSIACLTATLIAFLSFKYVMNVNIGPKLYLYKYN
ncbi:adhesion G-protein coupled receptor G2-like [Anneissia japonica]|uniref:adhesion G-protein coupled receptor G2-like n=1 Tax=Anneissia japonica TaxID=1529436 RepID=UPI0014259D05|nr:adhesion G-protein coupled receptor G2-like [Anneissia japonica]